MTNRLVQPPPPSGTTAPSGPCGTAAPSVPCGAPSERRECRDGGGRLEGSLYGEVAAGNGGAGGWRRETVL